LRAWETGKSAQPIAFDKVVGLYWHSAVAKNRTGKRILPPEQQRGNICYLAANKCKQKYWSKNISPVSDGLTYYLQATWRMDE
jgi:hypothetical protein